MTHHPTSKNGGKGKKGELIKLEKERTKKAITFAREDGARLRKRRRVTEEKRPRGKSWKGKLEGS